MKKTSTTMSSPATTQDNYFIRFARRKANCIFLLITLLISLLSVLQIFVSKADEKLISNLAKTLIVLLRETHNTTDHLFTNESLYVQ